jgi:glycosyltransferase involved in cell wall biosynthesis
MICLFSVIVPVFNVAPYLRRAIDSVLNQNYTEEVEIIFVDDGSTDESGSICDEYAKSQVNIRVIHKKNEGLSSARNAGLDIATGEYIVFLDSDDWLDSDALSIFQNALATDKPDLIFFSHRCAFSDGTIKLRSPIEGPFEIILEIDNFLLTHLLNIEAWSMVYRRKFLEEKKLRFIKGIFHEDEIFTMQAGCAAKTIINLNYDGYNYFQRSDSIMGSTSEGHLQKRFQDFCFIICKLAEMLHNFPENSGKYKNILFRINRLRYFLFENIVFRKISYSVANNCYRRMKNNGLFPFPKRNNNISEKIIHGLVKTCPLFILQYLYPKIYIIVHCYSKIILFPFRKQKKAETGQMD